MPTLHIEHVTNPKAAPWDTCPWEQPYQDYDGSTASFECGEMADWRLFRYDPWPDSECWVTDDLCRAHANLALYYERHTDPMLTRFYEQEAANA